jgi:hypothetical protein
MENLRRFFSIFEVRGGNFFLTWCDSNMIIYFYCKTDNLSCLNKKNCFVNSKVKGFSCGFMSSAWTNTWGSLCQSFCLFYTQALVARTTPTPFSNFLFTNLFSIEFLYFFIISSLFPYFNLFVSIFIQSYANIKLHVSTL